MKKEVKNMKIEESIEGSKKKFTNESIEGIYGFSASGSLVDFGSAKISGPIVVVGIMNFDGDGGGSSKGNANTVPPLGSFSFTATSFTYQVNPDGTGTTAITVPSVGVINLSFVIVNNGKEILFIRTDTGAIESGIAKRQE